MFAGPALRRVAIPSMCGDCETTAAIRGSAAATSTT